MIRMELVAQVARFLVVGVANTLVGIGSIYLLKWTLGVGDVPANLVGYLIGLTVSFVLNRSWTFRHEGRLLPAAVRFIGVFGVAYLANLTFMLFLRDQMAVNAYWAHLLAVAPYTAIFFLGSRLIVFRVSPAQNLEPHGAIESRAEQRDGTL